MIELFIFNSFFIIGVSYATYYEYDKWSNLTAKNPLWFLRYAIRNLPDKLYDPIIGCVKCMPTVWGTLIFWGYVITQGIEIEPLLFVKFVGYHLSLVGTGHIYGSITEGK